MAAMGPERKNDVVAVLDVPIAHAHAGGLDLDPHLTRLRTLLLQLNELEGLVDLGQNRSTHDASPQSWTLESVGDLRGWRGAGGLVAGDGGLRRLPLDRRPAHVVREPFGIVAKFAAAIGIDAGAGAARG